jgi:hypothetical protein
MESILNSWQNHVRQRRLINALMCRRSIQPQLSIAAALPMHDAMLSAGMTRSWLFTAWRLQANREKRKSMCIQRVVSILSNNLLQWPLSRFMKSRTVFKLKSRASMLIFRWFETVYNHTTRFILRAFARRLIYALLYFLQITVETSSS